MTIELDMRPGETQRVTTSRAIKTLVIPNADVANASTEQFLSGRDIIIQSGPAVKTLAATNIQAYDEDSNLVANIVVRVAPPLDRPAAVWVHKNGWIAYRCNPSEPCLDIPWPNYKRPDVQITENAGTKTIALPKRGTSTTPIQLDLR